MRSERDKMMTEGFALELASDLWDYWGFSQWISGGM